MFNKTKEKVAELKSDLLDLGKDCGKIALTVADLQIDRLHTDEHIRDQNKTIEVLKSLLLCVMDYYIMLPEESMRLKHCLDNGYQIIPSGTSLVVVVRNKKPKPLKDKPKSKAKKRS